MHYTIFLHKSPGNGYVATAPLFPDCIGRGQTREEALAHIHQAIAAALADVIEVTAVEVDTPALSNRANPWLETAGMFKEDPLFDEVLKEVELYRLPQLRYR